MELIFNIFALIILIAGIILVTRNIMVYNIRKVAIYLKLNNNVVGQLLGYATSMPELISAIVAGSVGLISASITNVLSSNIINVIFLIIVSLIFGRTKSLKKKKFLRDYIFAAVSIIIPIVLIISNNSANPLSIIAFAILYILFLISVKNTDYFADEIEDIKIEGIKEEKELKEIPKRKLSLEKKHRIGQSIFFLLLSVVLLYVLGTFLGNILESLGNKYMIPGYVIGIIMGVLTSIPELITFISSYKKHRKPKNINHDIGAVETVNNMVSSNISNICIIQTVAILCYILFAK